MKHPPHRTLIIVSAAALTAALICAGAWKMPSDQTKSGPEVQKPREQLTQVALAPSTSDLPFPETTPAPRNPAIEKTAPAQAFNGVIGHAVQLSGGTLSSETARLASAMAALGPDAIPELGAAMQAARSVSAKTTIAQALAMIGTSEAADQLVWNLEAIQDPAKRKAVGQALASTSDMYELETLTSALSLVDDPVLRESVNAAIAQGATADTVQYLTELYRAPPTIPTQADNVIAALSGIVNPAAADTLRQIVSGAPELPLQTAAATSLSLIGTPEALEGLLGGLFRVADTNPPYRQTLLTLLANTSNPAATDWLTEQNASSNLPADVASSISAALNNVRRRNTAGR